MTRMAVVLLLLLLADTVCAAPPSTSEAEARSHYELGKRHYNLGDFDIAIDEFKAAYALSPEPGLLFNIAQAYRAKHDRERALFFYGTYLREDPAAHERPFVEARIAELRAERPRRAAPVATRASADGPADGSAGHGLKIAGVAIAGSGLALGGMAVVFGVQSAESSDEVSRYFREGKTWNAHAAEAYADGQRAQTTAWILGTTGVAALVTGGILYGLGVRAQQAKVGVLGARGGAGMSIECAF